MPIKETKVTIAFADKNGQSEIVLLRDDNQHLNYVRVTMHRVEQEGYLALCQRLGDLALRMLVIAHPNEFANFPSLRPPPHDYDGPHGRIHALIGRSSKFGKPPGFN